MPIDKWCDPNSLEYEFMAMFVQHYILCPEHNPPNNVLVTMDDKKQISNRLGKQRSGPSPSDRLLHSWWLPSVSWPLNMSWSTEFSQNQRFEQGVIRNHHPWHIFSISSRELLMTVLQNYAQLFCVIFLGYETFSSAKCMAEANLIQSMIVAVMKNASPRMCTSLLTWLKGCQIIQFTRPPG